MRGWRWSGLCGVLAICAGCATLLQPETQQVTIHSNPAGATVLLNGEIRGTTPLALTLHPQGTYRLRLERPGYAPYTQDLAHRTGFPTWGTLAYPVRELEPSVLVTLQPHPVVAR
jgi:hypothetical protein